MVSHGVLAQPGQNLTVYANGVEFARTPSDFVLNETIGMYLCHWPFWGDQVHYYQGFMVRNRSMTS